MPQECKQTSAPEEGKKFHLTFTSERKHGLQFILELHGLAQFTIRSFDSSSSFTHRANQTIPTLQMGPLLPAILTALSSVQPCLSKAYPPNLQDAVQRIPQQGKFPDASRLITPNCSTFSHSILPYVAWLKCVFSEDCISIFATVPCSHTWLSMFIQKEVKAQCFQVQWEL